MHEPYVAELIRRIRKSPISIASIWLKPSDDDAIRSAAIEQVERDHKTFVERHELQRTHPYWADLRWRGNADARSAYVDWCGFNVGAAGFAWYPLWKSERQRPVQALRFHFRYRHHAEAFADAWKSKSPDLHMP